MRRGDKSLCIETCHRDRHGCWRASAHILQQPGGGGGGDGPSRPTEGASQPLCGLSEGQLHSGPSVNPSVLSPSSQASTRQWQQVILADNSLLSDGLCVPLGLMVNIIEPG